MGLSLGPPSTPKDLCNGGKIPHEVMQVSSWLLALPAYRFGDYQGATDKVIKL